MFTTLTASGITTLNNGTNATAPTGSGTLQVTGGVGISQDLWVAGNIYGNMTSVVNSILVSNDSMLYLDSPNPSPYTFDIGVYGHFVGGVAGNYQHTGLIRDYNTNYWYLFSNVPEPAAGGVVNFTYGNLVYDSMKLGAAVIANNTVATNSSSGALQVAGGAGIAGNAYVGAAMIAGGGTISTGQFAGNYSDGIIFDYVTNNGRISVGTGDALTFYSGGLAGIQTATLTSLGAFTANSIQNTPIGSTTANTGVFTSVNTVSGGQITGYLTGAIGANTANSGAFTTLTASGNIVAASGTASTNTTTGALVVAGGIGASGAVNAGGGVNLQGNGYLTTDQATATLFNTVATTINLGGAATAINIGTTAGTLIINNPTVVGSQATQNLFNTFATTVNFAGAATSLNMGAATGNTTVNNGFLATSNAWINSGGTAANLIVQGNIAAGYSNLLVTNGATGQVGIKVSPGSISPYISLQVNATDSMLIPVGATGDRPAIGSEKKGMLRFNTSNNLLEFWDGTSWNTGGAVFTTILSDQFSGNGTQTNFTLSQSSSTAGTLVMINGVVQIPSIAYSVTGTTLAFTEPPLATDVIDARTITTTATVASIVDGKTSISVSNAAPAIYATVRNSNVWVANTSTFFSGGISTFNSNVSLTQNTPTTIDTFSTSQFRSAKYIITISDFANTKYQSAEVLVTQNGTTATATIYGVSSTSGSSFANYSATISSDNVLLQANSTSLNSYACVQQIYMPV